MITDACPECESDHMDIQALTFNKVRLHTSPLTHGHVYMASSLQCRIIRFFETKEKEKKGLISVLVGLVGLRYTRHGWSRVHQAWPA